MQRVQSVVTTQRFQQQ